MDEAVKIAVEALDSKKAMNIEVLRVGDITVMADYFVICSGSSNTQIRALGDEVEYQLKEKLNLDPLHREGYQTASWVLLDYGFMIVHVFHQDAREFYKLERLWADADRLDTAALTEKQEGQNDEI